MKTKTVQLNYTQKTRLKVMCVSAGYDTEALGVNNPMQKETPANWLEICVRLFEWFVGYNHQKMGDMMYAFMLGNQNPIDYLYKEYLKKNNQGK